MARKYQRFQFDDYTLTVYNAIRLIAHPERRQYFPCPKSSVARFYSKVNELRRLRGLLRSDVAQAVGVSRWTVRRWEQGRHTPKPCHVRRLAAVLGVNTQELWEPGSASANGPLCRVTNEPRTNEAKLFRDSLLSLVGPVLMAGGAVQTAASHPDASDYDAGGESPSLPSFDPPPVPVLVALLDGDGFSLPDIIGLLRGSALEEARRIAEIYDQMTDEERASANLDHLIAAAAAPTAKVVEALYIEVRHIMCLTAGLKAAMHAPDVMDAAISRAKTKNGYPECRLLLQIAGVAPVPQNQVTFQTVLANRIEQPQQIKVPSLEEVVKGMDATVNPRGLLGVDP